MTEPTLARYVGNRPMRRCRLQRSASSGEAHRHDVLFRADSKSILERTVKGTPANAGIRLKVADGNRVRAAKDQVQCPADRSISLPGGCPQVNGLAGSNYLRQDLHQGF